MRQIKFRGKRVDSSEWVYGSLIDFQDGDFAITVDHSKPTWIGVIPQTVHLFTGLHNNNRKEIYEGDVFDLGAGWIDVVRWNDSKCGFGLYCPQKEKWDDNSLEGIETKESIGNIHDNPELLQERERRVKGC